VARWPTRIEGCIREAAEALLGDQMFAFLGPKLVNNLCPPGAFHTVRAVAARWRYSQTPIRPGCVRVVGLQHVRAVIPAIVARRRDYPFWGWYLLGVLFSWL
jgi:hypothetical protein